MMNRNILIIDDHDDLASALKDVFENSGNCVVTESTVKGATAINSLNKFDVIISDFDAENFPSEIDQNIANAKCLPENVPHNFTDKLKIFKLCASNLIGRDYDERELKSIIETILEYKIKFVDRVEIVQNLRERIEFEIPSAISAMNSILAYLIKRVEKLGVVKPEKSNLFIALDEAFVNAVKHGNKFDSQKLVKITADISSREARFTVEDEGEGFDVNAIPDPTKPENLFKESGRGVMFIYNIMDEVKYNERGNRLEMIKKSELV